MPDLASSEVLDGPREAEVAGRAALACTVRYAPDRESPVTLWLDRALPLVLRASAGRGLRQDPASSEILFEVTSVTEPTAADRATAEGYARRIAKIRADRLAALRGPVTDEGEAREAAAPVVAAFGPDAELDAVVSYPGDGRFVFRLLVGGEPVFVARHPLDELFGATLGRVIVLGVRWGGTIDASPRVSWEVLDGAARHISRFTSLLT